jgi:uncharacterized membrane protein YfcA
MKVVIEYLKTLNRKTILTIISSITIVLGVFLPFIQVNIKLSIMGMVTAQSATVDYWNNGNGDGKYLIMLAIASLIFVFVKWYKALWVTFGLSIGVITYSIINSINTATSIKKGPMGEMVDVMLKNTKVAVTPREGLVLLIIGLITLGIAAGIKNKNQTMNIETDNQISE